MKKIGRFFSKLGSAIRSERAENTITMIIMFPLLWAIIMTIIDFGCYFNNRSLLIQDLRDGARTVAILGGTDNKLTKAYGVYSAPDHVTMENCDNYLYGTDGATKSSGEDIIMAGYKNDQVTRAVANKICANHGYVQYGVYNLACGPKTTGGVGQEVWCQASYVYNGMPGSAMSLLGSSFRSMSGQMDPVTVSDGTSSQTAYDDASSSSKSHYKVSTSSGSMGWNSGTLRAAAQAETITSDLS